MLFVLIDYDVKIRIDNSWLSINKIIDYNANDLVPTKVISRFSPHFLSLAALADSNSTSFD